MAKKSLNVTAAAEKAADELLARKNINFTDAANRGLELLADLMRRQDAGARIIVRQEGEEDIRIFLP